MAGDSRVARILCYGSDPVRVNLIIAFTELAMTDMSPDQKNKHIPSCYLVIKKSNGGAAVDVYDQDNKCFHTLELIYVDGKWQIADA